MKKWLLLLLLLAGACRADVVRVGFGDKVPPYSMAATKDGIQVDIFRAALAVRGHTMLPVFIPVRRLGMAFGTLQVDAVTIDDNTDLSGMGALYAEPAVTFENVFFSLKDRRIVIHTPADLARLRVMAFPGALARFPDWLGAPSRAGHYSEQADQGLQVLALQSGRYDVILSDRAIFRYYAHQYERDAGWGGLEVEEHPFLEHQERDYHTVFRNAALRDDFEAGLHAIKQDGRYKAIYDKYIKP